ncbi:hypothetical protein BaRGS_00039327 [Batillaria attramentaria]|uniref:Uncharacterized protein n=1 Tax=Batillaria attramentaria TaxID=370345 RepID=A0ABD0J3G5_9CAEN
MSSEGASTMTSVFGKDRYHSQRRNALPDIFESVDVTGMAMLTLKCAQCRLSTCSPADTPASTPSGDSPHTVTTCSVCGETVEAAGHVTSDADSGHQDTNNTSLLFEALKQNEIVNKMASKDGDNNSANNPKSEETARSRSARRGSSCSDGSDSFQTMTGFRPETCAKLSLLC